MSILSNISNVIISLEESIDSIVTSDEERLKAKKELQKDLQSFKLNMHNLANGYENTITKRWASDNEHLITKLVRPISYLLILGLFCIIVLSDGNIGQFKINEAYIPVIQTLLVTMTVAYFGSRGAEKITKGFKNGK